ncbi:MAG: DMT family transporter [bacterium]|nr:DMT family transporter [bacterium]
MTPPFPYFGETMAVLAAFIFSWTSVFFTTAGQRLGVTNVNLLRLPGATVCLGLTHYALTGRIWPADLAFADQAWIGASGIIGLAIGDSALFRAFTLVGPRRSMTMMALAPVFTVFTAWGMLDERLSPLAFLGIALAIGGVMLATLGKDQGGGRFRGLPPEALRKGLLLALVGSAGQGLGSTLAKLGMAGTGEGIDALGATLVRLAWATVAYWLVIAPRLSPATVRRQLSDRRGLLALGIAILMGPFISVWCSLIAVKHTDTGVAQVLLSMVPVFVIVPAWVVYRDRPSRLSLLGVLVAIGGGAVLFLR